MNKRLMISPVRLALVLATLAGMLHARPVTKVDPGKVDEFVSAGWDALSLGDIKTARDTFTDILAVDEKNNSAARGLGATLIQLGEFDRARVLLEKSCGGKPGTDRALVMNLAAAHLRKDNWKRALVFLTDYLAKAPDATSDEAVINALGITLNRAPMHAHKDEAWKSAEKTYSAACSKMEQARKDEKRWGLQWQPAREVDARMKRWHDAQRQVDDLYRQLVQNEESQATEQAYLNSLGRKSVSGIQAAKSRLRRLEDAHADLDRKIRDQEAKIERPTFPANFEPVAMTHNDSVTVAAGIPKREPIADLPSQAPRRPSGRGPAPGSQKPTPSRPETSPEPEPENRPVAPSAPAPRVKRVVKHGVAFPVSDTHLITSESVASGATELSLQTRDGDVIDADVVRSDAGLTLLRSKRPMTAWLALADKFDGGAIRCIGFPDASIFDPVASVLTGKAAAPRAGWTVQLARNPRLPGAPLMAGDAVVGVVISSRDDEPAALPAIPLDELRRFLGADAPATAVRVGDVTSCVYQLMATREVKE